MTVEELHKELEAFIHQGKGDLNVYLNDTYPIHFDLVKKVGTYTESRTDGSVQRMPMDSYEAGKDGWDDQ